MSRLPAMLGLLLLSLSLASCARGPRRQHPEFDWREEPHHISLLFGQTSDKEIEGRRVEANTVGIDYEYRLSEFLGVGTVVERAFSPLDATTVLAAADLHITRAFVVQTGPGFEHVSGEAGYDFIYRVGALYEMEMNGYTISPQLHLNMRAGDDSIIYGVAFGFPF